MEYLKKIKEFIEVTHEDKMGRMASDKKEIVKKLLQELNSYFSKIFNGYRFKFKVEIEIELLSSQKPEEYSWNLILNFKIRVNNSSVEYENLFTIIMLMYERGITNACSIKVEHLSGVKQDIYEEIVKIYGSLIKDSFNGHFVKIHKLSKELRNLKIHFLESQEMYNNTMESMSNMELKET